MDNSFSINRLGLLLKRDFVEGKKQFAVGALAMFALLSLMFIIVSPAFVQEEVEVFVATFPVLIMYSFGIGISASLMFAPMRTKQGRVNLFKLPATACEKYVEQFLIFVVGFTLAFVGCVHLAEAVKCVVAPLLFRGELYAGELSKFVNHFAVPACMPGEEMVMMKLIAMAVAGTMLGIGMYALGAALWPKYSFLKVTAAYYVVSMAASAVLQVAMYILPEMNLEFADALDIMTALSAVAAVAAVVMLVASYIVFRRKDVIS